MIVTALIEEIVTSRVCGNFKMRLNRKLTLLTATNQEPEDFLNTLLGNWLFCEITLMHIYFQLPLDKEFKRSMVITIS